MNKNNQFRLNSSHIKTFVGCLILTFLIIIPYQQLMSHNFIPYDDDVYIFQNQHVYTGLSIDNVIWAFCRVHSGNWHPLTWISHMTDCSLFGLNPGAHHFVNLLFHIMNTLMIFLIFNRITQKIWHSFFIAALFAIHPLHVESVAWASERKDVLSTFLALISIAFYVRYVEEKNFKQYCLVLFFFTLSLMAKPMMVTLPFLLLMLDFWPLKRFEFRDLKSEFPLFFREKIPLMIISFISCCITFWSQNLAGAVQSLDKISLWFRIENIINAYGWYFFKTFLPFQLAIFYPHPKSHIAFEQLAWGAAVIILGLWLSWKLKDRYAYATLGFLWFFGTLVPVIGLVQVGLQAYADRYTYVPLIGIFIILVWGICDIFSKFKAGKFFSYGILICLVLVLTGLCKKQVKHWQSGTSLFQHAMLTIPDNFVAMTHMDTIVHLKTAISINPTYVPALYNLGTLLLKQGKYKKAQQYFIRAVQLNQNHPNIHNNLGAVFYKLGNIDKAKYHFKQALRIHPENIFAQKNIYLLKMHDKKNEH
ncbi:Tetratricopeptide TPR_2 repeat protein [Candidatus Magnetomorum sp. HK-1]|nr:Tetratricopeptide TPR_2 repeat protein [Candidatus Magnetomorum sp. HK-1]